MKPSIPKGTRDFSPKEMVRRNFIFDTIKTVFQRFGYQPIETPAMEKTETLMGKYGEEGDRLIFRVLNSGDYLSKGDVLAIENKDSGKLANSISEKALRYDLTVPFARYVVQHQNEITFPFKRYQIQPVWRADRPQKGRFREFYQCDADVVGSDSLLNEVELIQIIDEVFSKLNLKVVVKLNNRKVLSGLAEYLDASEYFMDLVVALDKYEKIGDKIYLELKEKGVQLSKIEKLKNFIDNTLAIEQGKDRVAIVRDNYFHNSEIGLKGLNEIEEIMKSLANIYSSTGREIPDVRFDISLARGLNYYTGAIIEVQAAEGNFTSSISGGGRYDDLTGVFGMKNVSGVGISFGADRIYVVMEELGLFPELKDATTQVMFVNFGEKEEAYCLPLIAKLRKEGINAEIFPDAGKIKKQMTYANNKEIPFVVMVGSNEMESGQFSVKDMKSGEQSLMYFEALLGLLKT